MRKQPLCPNCGKKLEVMHAFYVGGTTWECLCHCESCVDEIPFDWKVTYSAKNGYTNFERHFWG